MVEWKGLLLGAMLAVVGAYILNQPAPSGFQQPYKLKLTIASMRVLNGFTIIAEKIGFCTSRINCTRAQIEWWAARQEVNQTGVQVTDDVYHGVDVRIYDPVERKEPKNGPAVIYIPGGMWTFGSKTVYEATLTEQAKKLQMPIIFVDYRKMPEYHYPAQLHDCENVTLYVMQRSQELNLDPRRIALAGDGAGGNLAAALALKLRTNRNIPRLKLQVLLYPMLQAFDFNLPSFQNDLPGTLLSLRMLVEFWLVYMGRDPKMWPLIMDGAHVTPDLRNDYGQMVDKLLVPVEIRTEKPRRTVSGGHDNVASLMSNHVLHPHVCPLMLKHFDKIPETYILTLQNDLSRDEGIIFARRLKKSGIKVTHKHWPAGYHSMLGLTEVEINKILDELTEFIREKL